MGAEAVSASGRWSTIVGVRDCMYRLVLEGLYAWRGEGVLHRVARCAIERRPPPLSGDGGYRRDV